MKHRKNLKYVLSVTFLLWLVLSMSSCIREELIGEMEQPDYSSVTISLQMPAPDVTDPMTRGGAMDFDKMSDINILIAEGGRDNSRILDRVYFSFAEVESGSVIDGTKITYTETEMAGEKGEHVRTFKLDFAPEYFESIEGINLKTCRFYAVANWGSAIEGPESVGELKGMKAESVKDANDAYNGQIAAPNVMFGESAEAGSEPIPDAEPGEVRRKIEIELKRTAAMVTLVMDGKGLNAGVVITPRRISLHNVPNTCTIGYDNSVTTEFGGIEVKDGAVTANGEVKDGQTWSEGYSLVGKLMQDPESESDWSGFGEGTRFRTSIGKHYQNFNYEGEPEGNILDQTVQPLFLYENIHGGDEFGATGVNVGNQMSKRPARAASAAEDDIWAAAGGCSYIEIEADYTQYDDPTDMSIARKGTAKWRFFLGENEYNNFDVVRNTNYKLTLTLTETGIGEGNASWRVDSDELKEPDVVGEANMVVGGGGEMFCVEFNDPNIINETQNFEIKYEGDGGFVFAYASTSGNDKDWEWLDVSAINHNKAYKYYVTADKQIWFFVMPFLPKGDSMDETDIERSANLTFMSTGEKEVYAEVSFTQYKPLTIKIRKEDVQDKNDLDMWQVREIIENYYDYKFDVNEEPFTFYLDRVDRVAMPWGFSKILLDKNHTSGFENVYHLIQPINPGINCQDHIDEAEYYLPTGKGYKAPDTNYIDYTNGSCMMHAAMENWFQRFSTKEELDKTTPDDLLRTTLPPRPSKDPDVPDGLSYGWCVPSIVGWQLIEKVDRHYREHVKPLGVGIFDPKHPISWQSYWTSNAGTADMANTYPKADGRTYSFAYQFDRGLDAIKENEIYPSYLLLPRTTPLSYRLLNIRPEYVIEGDAIGSDDSQE